MRSLDELVSAKHSAMPTIRHWITETQCQCQILPPSDDRDRALLAVQVPTSSPLGVIAYETGGILVDDGWLRFLGSGHPLLPRNLADWNDRGADGLCLVADDVVGGFFAIDTGAFGDQGDMYYWAPDSLAWEPIGFDFDLFLRWSLTAALSEFYQHVRWPNWKDDLVDTLPAADCFMFEPPLWSENGSVTTSKRRTIGVADAYALKLAAQQEGNT